MKSNGDRFTYDRERALGLGIRELASDLRLVEPADYITFVRTERFANIANLVASSAELFFKPGTIAFGQSGDVELSWDRQPAIALDMEFRHRSVSVYFRLILEAEQAGVEITYLTFEGAADSPDENTRRLVEALADARLDPVADFTELALWKAADQAATSLGQA
ncbi:hypothetical protein [Hyphomicrobium sulfonivorans]|uniref:OrfY n=1 Tax=Hyphomicrobium sulfonivorans TaxID=121290 RepID=A0A109BET8_HYPSL|nr:hypothetical protein [Hyphomicrobium sulfonivorans]KWT67446.1 OrfY [Hyphomicrobium sulfonivorans]